MSKTLYHICTVFGVQFMVLTILVRYSVCVLSLTLTPCRHSQTLCWKQESVQPAGCKQDLPARTMILLFSAEGNKIQQHFTFVTSCCIEHGEGYVQLHMNCDLQNLRRIKLKKQGWLKHVQMYSPDSTMWKNTAVCWLNFLPNNYEDKLSWNFYRSQYSSCWSVILFVNRSIVIRNKSLRQFCVTNRLLNWTLTNGWKSGPSRFSGVCIFRNYSYHRLLLFI